MKKESILMIDDDEISLLILQNALEMEGYQVIASTDSLQATELISKHKPNVIVMDIFMPGKDGFELIKEIRKLCPKTFIVAVSGNDECLRAIKALGADATLSKLNMPDALIDYLKMPHK